MYHKSRKLLMNFKFGLDKIFFHTFSKVARLDEHILQKQPISKVLNEIYV